MCLIDSPLLRYVKVNWRKTYVSYCLSVTALYKSKFAKVYVSYWLSVTALYNILLFIDFYQFVACSVPVVVWMQLKTCPGYPHLALARHFQSHKETMYAYLTLSVYSFHYPLDSPTCYNNYQEFFSSFIQYFIDLI